MRLAVSVAVFAVGLLTGASAQPPYDDEKTPAGWAWAQIRKDEIADFAKRCGALDPRTKAGWDDPCRQIPAQFLLDVLTVPKWRDQVLRHRVRLRGARIGGIVDLSDTVITTAASIDASRIEGDLILADSHWNRLLSLRGSTLAGQLLAARTHTDSSVVFGEQSVVEGDVDLKVATIDGSLVLEGSWFRGALDAYSLNVTGSLRMDGATFGGPVNLVDAKIGSGLAMTMSSLHAALMANSLSVRGSMLMNDHATFRGPVDLVNAKIDGFLNMQKSSFLGAVNANSARVEGSLLMSDHATFHADLNLVAAKIGPGLEMGGSLFSGEVRADSVSVGGNMLMNDQATFRGPVNLVNAKIDGFLNMQKSWFLGKVDAYSVSVAGSLLMSDHATFGGDVSLVDAKIGLGLEMVGSSFSGDVRGDSVRVGGSIHMNEQATFRGPVNLVNANIGGVLNLDGATAASLDLSDLVARELLFGGLKWSCADGTTLHWRLGDPARQNTTCRGTDQTVPTLSLRNAHVDAFQDSVDAWPPAIDLEGFHYERIGGLRGHGPIEHSSEEWTDWLARYGTFSPQPYTQLSTALAAAGHRETAEAIQFVGRERERDEARKRRHLGEWAWLTILSYVAGYGIGLYTIRILWWVLLLTVLGAIVLWYSPNARAQGLPWRLGASLHRLLPIIELSKEFTNFFDNPPPEPDQPRNLSRCQVAYFAGHAIAGWVLGVLLIAAMGGIIQKG